MLYNFHFFFSLKHPAKYIGKKPRKYTIPAKPLAPNIINDQVRIYSTNSTSGDGQVMHNTHSSQYLRVRLNLQKFRENNRHFLRVMPLLEYYSNTCSELLCVVCQFLISFELFSLYLNAYYLKSRLFYLIFDWIIMIGIFHDFSKIMSSWSIIKLIPGIKFILAG